MHWLRYAYHCVHLRHTVLLSAVQAATRSSSAAHVPHWVHCRLLSRVQGEASNCPAELQTTCHQKERGRVGTDQPPSSTTADDLKVHLPSGTGLASGVGSSSAGSVNVLVCTTG